MPNLTPTSSFDDVPELETNTLALGGPGGPMNLPAQALLNRTQWLKDNAVAGSSSPYAVGTGTANACAAAYTPAITALADGMKLRFLAAATNTGAATFAPDALTAQPIVGGAYAALQGGEILSGGEVELTWNATLGAWVITAQAGGSPQVPDATKSKQSASKGQVDQVYSDLASTAPGKGDSLVGFIQSGTGAVASTVQNELRDRISVKQFGAAGDGATDDSSAILAALTKVGAGGQVSIPQGMRCYVNSTLQVPDGCTLSGDAGPWRGYADNLTDFYAIGPAIHLGPLGKIVLNAGASIKDLIVIRAGLTFPVYYADASAWTGNGIEAAGDNFSVVGCSVFGFGTGIYSSGAQRPRIENVQGDCWNGIYVGSNFDAGVISNCHFWPFLTAYSLGSGPVQNDLRRNNGYYFDGVCDWLKVNNCFCYGYKAGYTINGPDYMTLTACSADNITADSGYYVGSIGFTIGSGSSGIQLIGCQAAAQESGVSVNAGSGNTVSIVGGVYFGNRVNAINYTSGDLVMCGGAVLRGQGSLGNGILFNSGSARAMIDDVYMVDYASPGIPLNMGAALSTANVQIGRINYVNCAAPVGGTGSYVLAQVASSGSVTIPQNGDVFQITGTTNIGNFITNVWAGRRITLVFASGLTLVNSSSLVLAGSVNATVTANSSMSFVYNGGVWYEASRQIH